MQKLLLKNIKNLVSVYQKAPLKLAGKEMNQLPCIENAWLACDDGLIVDFGEMADFPGITDWKDLTVIDCSGKIVMPCFVDSHTHIVYAGNREQEFEDKINVEKHELKGGTDMKYIILKDRREGYKVSIYRGDENDNRVFPWEQVEIEPKFFQNKEVGFDNITTVKYQEEEKKSQLTNG